MCTRLEATREALNEDNDMKQIEFDFIEEEDEIDIKDIKDAT